MADLIQRVEENIRSRKLLKRGQKILAAVSGGLDSMTLLQILDASAKKNRWKIFIAHFNHQLRGRKSKADEMLVRKTAAKLKLPVFIGRAGVKAFANKSKLSIEMAARKLRHEFFAKAAREEKIKMIALAHHADDQVELFFLRLLRGAGGEGLAGMKWNSQSPADKTISLVRPLLDLKKSELAEFARENKIRFRDDATNFSNVFLRNRIRNELLPLLRKNYQPSLNKIILRVMEILDAESEFVSKASTGILSSGLVKRAANPPRVATCHANKRLAGSQPQQISDLFHPKQFKELPPAMQRRVLQIQLAENGITGGFDLIESLRQSANQFVSIGAHVSVARNGFGEIRLYENSKSQFNANESAVELSPGKIGETIFAQTKFNWEIVARRERSSRQKKSAIRNPQSTTHRELFDADKTGGKIVLRHWRAGDRFQPIGMKSPKKLQDLFVNAKIPREQRHKLILAATAGGEIFWVEGLRISENFKITPRTKRQLIWRPAAAD